MRSYADYTDQDGNLIIAKNETFTEASLLAVEAAIGLVEFARIQAGEIVAVLHDCADGWWSRSELTTLANWVARRKYEEAAAPWIAHCTWLAANQKGEEHVQTCRDRRR